MIMSHKICIQELHDKLLDNLGLRISGNSKISVKSQNCLNLQPIFHSFFHNKNFDKTATVCMF